MHNTKVQIYEVFLILKCLIKYGGPFRPEMPRLTPDPPNLQSCPAKVLTTVKQS